MSDIIDQWFSTVARNGDFRTMHVWDGDGDPNRVYELNFEGGYINRADVKAFMVETQSQYRTDLTVNFTNGNTVTLSQAVPAGTHRVTIYRDTPKAQPLASFVDGAIINATNLDRNAKQAVFSVAEMVDRFDSVVEDATDALRTAYAALGLSQEAINTADNAKAQAAQAELKADVAVATAQGADIKVDGAVATANRAEATANAIDGKATTAMNDAAAAVVTANAAEATANAIDGKAQSALDKSTSAETQADAAVATANSIDGKATQALNNSVTANQNATAALTAATAALQKSQNLADLPNKATSRTNLDVYSRAEVDSRISNYLGEVSWHPSRTRTPGGTVPGDGQRIGNVRGLYPDFVNRIIAGDFPTTTETSWQANPALRAAYVYDAIANTLRFPDYNGVQPGSYAAPVLRGDGTFSPGSVQESGVPELTGRVTANTNWGIMTVNGAATGVFDIDPSTSTPNVAGSGSPSSEGRALLFRASKANSLYKPGLTEVRMNAVVGVHVIRVAFAAGNTGSVDVMQLQADLELLKASATSVNSNIGYALVNANTTALGERKVLPNPFGSKPVVCFVEVQINSKWAAPGWLLVQNGGSYGVVAGYVDGDGIVVQVGTKGPVSQRSDLGGGLHGTTSNPLGTSLPCRVHVFCVGQDISKLKQISQIDPALIAEFKSPAKPTGVRAVWTRSASEPGGAGSTFTFTESILGKTVYFACQANPDTFYLSTPVPAKPLPAIQGTVGNIPGGFTVLVSTESMYFRFSIAADGKTASVIATNGMPTLIVIYVDDYTPL